MDEFGDMGGMNTFQQKETIDANNIKDDSIKTDVEDVDSDAYYAVGTEKFPIFDVNQSEFFNNMKVDRQIINLIESVIPEEKKDDIPGVIFNQAGIAYFDGWNECIADIKSKLIGKE